MTNPREVAKKDEKTIDTSSVCCFTLAANSQPPHKSNANRHVVMEI